MASGDVDGAAFDSLAVERFDLDQTRTGVRHNEDVRSFIGQVDVPENVRSFGFAEHTDGVRRQPQFSER